MYITYEQLKNMTNQFYSDAKPVRKNELDDADVAGVWVNDHAKFTVTDRAYKLERIDGKSIAEEKDVIEAVKASNITNEQKCWVLNLLNGLNMQWTIGNIEHSVKGIRDFFEPLYAGTYGYDYDDEYRHAIYG